MLRGKKLDYDADFLAQVSLPNEKGVYKKFKSIAFAEQGKVPEDMLARCFQGDQGRLDYFAEQIRHINAQLDHLTNGLFSSYRQITRSITWRMAETRNENLHFDTYKKDLPNHHIRLFANIDNCPRIWRTSHSLEYVLKKSIHLLPRKFLREATPGRICHTLNARVFGGWDEAGREGAPKHIAYFEPGKSGWSIAERCRIRYFSVAGRSRRSMRSTSRPCRVRRLIISSWSKSSGDLMSVPYGSASRGNWQPVYLKAGSF